MSLRHSPGKRSRHQGISPEVIQSLWKSQTDFGAFIWGFVWTWAVPQNWHFEDVCGWENDEKLLDSDVPVYPMFRQTHIWIWLKLDLSYYYAIYCLSLYSLAGPMLFVLEIPRNQSGNLFSAHGIANMGLSENSLVKHHVTPTLW